MLSPESVLRLRGNTFKPLDSPIADSVPKITNSIGSHSTENLLSISARRRFSNVSDVVSRKLSNTIGWKIPTPTPVPTQDIVTQGKCLCGQYIRYRLKRSGVFNKRLALQRIRSIIGTPSVHVVREVFPALNYVWHYGFVFYFTVSKSAHPNKWNTFCRWAKNWSACIRNYFRASHDNCVDRVAVNCSRLNR